MCCDFHPEEDYRADTCIHDDDGLTGKRGVATARIELLLRDLYKELLTITVSCTLFDLVLITDEAAMK